MPQLRATTYTSGSPRSLTTHSGYAHASPRMLAFHMDKLLWSFKGLTGRHVDVYLSAWLIVVVVVYGTPREQSFTHSGHVCGHFYVLLFWRPLGVCVTTGCGLRYRWVIVRNVATSHAEPTPRY